MRRWRALKSSTGLGEALFEDTSSDMSDDRSGDTVRENSTYHHPPSGTAGDDFPEGTGARVRTQLGLADFVGE